MMSRVGLKEQSWMVRSEHHHPFIIFFIFFFAGWLCFGGSKKQMREKGKSRDQMEREGTQGNVFVYFREGEVGRDRAEKK